MATFIVWDTMESRKRLHGLMGIDFLITFMFVFSKAPGKVNWRPVLLGFLMQFLFGMAVLRWEYGSQKLGDLSELVITFIGFTRNGTNFVYGFLASPPHICGMEPVMAFSALPVLIYCASVVSLLYYYGVIQAILKRMAWAVQRTMGTTATESLNACACVFLGMLEAPLLIRPYLDKMTASELHAVMTSGFACIAGSHFAIFVSFGICPKYLLSSTVMSAPCSLACSKLLYPELEESQTASVEDLELPRGEVSNALESLSNGAVGAMGLVMAAIANMITFLAMLALLDSVIFYLGNLVGQDGWSFELLLGYIFLPLAYIMGADVSWEETMTVAQLMGTKTSLNEFIASRSALIATYALCGFANFSSVGILLAVLGGMAPHRKQVLANVAPRALVAGSISTFLTASLAGILVDTPIACHSSTAAMQTERGGCFNLTHVHQMLTMLVTKSPINGPLMGR